MKIEKSSSVLEKKNLANSLKEIRKSLNLTQEDFARSLGVRLNTVGRWERGETSPMFNITQVKNLLKILESVGVNPYDLPDN